MAFLSLVICGCLYMCVRDQVLPWYRWWRQAVTVRLLVKSDVVQQENKMWWVVVKMVGKRGAQTHTCYHRQDWFTPKTLIVRNVSFRGDSCRLQMRDRTHTRTACSWTHHVIYNWTVDPIVHSFLRFPIVRVPSWQSLLSLPSSHLQPIHQW